METGGFEMTKNYQRFVALERPKQWKGRCNLVTHDIVGDSRQHLFKIVSLIVSLYTTSEGFLYAH